VPKESYFFPQKLTFIWLELEIVLPQSPKHFPQFPVMINHRVYINDNIVKENKTSCAGQATQYIVHHFLEGGGRRL